jgi:phosphopantetheinyl transferase (holo-ACP synthase)
MITGIGFDIIDIARVEKASRKESFCKKIFTDNETAVFKPENTLTRPSRAVSRPKRRF